MGEELVGIVSVVDNIVNVARGLAHVGSIAEVLGEEESGTDHVTKGTGEGHGEILVEVSEGSVEISESSSANKVSEIAHDGRQELNNKVERGEESIESVGSELVVSIQ